MSIKRHFYNNSEYTINTEKNVVELTTAFHNKLLNNEMWFGKGFKKIGGSSLGDVLKLDQWKSQFTAFCRMAWIGLPILDRKYVDAGIAIEQKVLDKIADKLGEPVKGFDAKEYNYDYFAGKDDILGGLPDGLLEKSGVVIEVKTTGFKNLEKWKQWGIPVAYHKQSQLYTYLMGLNEYAIVATFLKEEDYLDPASYPINQRVTKLWKFKIDKTVVEDDIKKIKEWYNEYKASGVSPEFDIVKDKDQLDYLKCSTEQEWIELQEEWKKSGKIPANG
ncbi:MAG: hypothetical protein KAG04_01655 [Mycoplasmataceae bacterium]|nr:hypothetical protein [Mycoplasmataceae bacterium]